MITPTHIVCANIGDSRCILGTGKDPSGFVAMSSDHKPFHDIERARIELAQGIVHMKRVDGDLAVSRTFGDFSFKEDKTRGAEEQKVSCMPDFVVHERSPEDEFLLLACDGLWDVMDNLEASRTVRNIYSLGESDPVLVAEEMIDIALDKG